ncbi:MAG: methylated-DNA--[protein]-cysteine S-methyltransferase [Promethearchaeota archaeon]
MKEKFPSSFSQSVINNILSLKRGETTSYSEIGKNIDSKAYQAIGTVLKNNPIPLIIPCHRVIRKNGNIGGFMGETNNGWQLKLKKDLLNIESLNDL